jgi:class 3 adenylate cyclase/tetratricopeptide (TPR) repeat protein
MTDQRASTLTTILFTDLVNSTELMQRAGDEDAQRIFKAHYQMLRDAVSANGGSEVKSLGDGLMVAFASAADAVRCAIMVQQASRRGVRGERLAVKVGINAGEAMSQGDDYFGTPVVVARRLCDQAQPGQILCSAVIESLLAGRQAFSFHDLAPLELKGISTPVEAREVAYETERAGVLLTRTPFVGRGKEMARLQARLDEARAGHGGLVMLVGEPGIGKSRTIEEFAEQARVGGALVLAGRCFEGEWAPPYAPFAEAIAGNAKDAAPDVLGTDLGYGAPPVARLVPSLRERLPDIGEPVPLNPDEERFRLLDAVSQFIIAMSARAPVVLVLDDLHWADGGTIAMLHHVARFLPGQRTLLLGAYRAVELDRQHPLADALAALRSEAEYERILVKGLDEGAVRALITDIAEHDIPDAFVQAISAETDGNPFFIREILIHLAEEGKIYRQDGRWTANVSIAEMGIPEGVRQVIGRRLSRLSENANRLLSVGSGFNGPFRVDLLADAAGLAEADALDAIDAALDAQLVQPAGSAESYDFTHALIRHTLYAELSPSRQVRLHRQIAEAMERVYGDRAPAHAAELAYQYHRSASIPGAERGVDYAIVAGEGTEAAAAWDEAVTFFRMALDLMPEDDSRRPRALGRLAIALSWALHFEEAVETATRAADALVEGEGGNAAGDFLAEVAQALADAGYPDGAWVLAPKGVSLKGDRRDAAWVRLRELDLRRLDGTDPSYIGIQITTPERLEFQNTVRKLRLFSWQAGATSRLDAQERVRELRLQPGTQPGFDDPRFAEAGLGLFFLGEARRSGELWSALADDYERSGRIALAAECSAQVSRSQTARGEFAEADRWYQRGMALAARVGGASNADLQLATARYERAVISGEGWENLFADAAAQTALQPPPQDRWAFAGFRAGVARGFAWMGWADPALAQIAELVAPLDLATGDTGVYCFIACTAAETLWLLDRRDHIDTIERNLREKTIQPDLCWINVDSRLSLGRLCALQGQHEEAARWFADARVVLEEDGARPLRAIADYDEALMYARRAAAGDRERALPLLDAALTQFQEIGMTGWLRRGEELRKQVSDA